MTKHRLRRRGESRYWDCVNPGCGEFVYDMKEPARYRIPSRVVTAAADVPRQAAVRPRPGERREMMPRQKCPFCQNHPRLEVERGLRLEVNALTVRIATLEAENAALKDRLDAANLAADTLLADLTFAREQHDHLVKGHGMTPPAEVAALRRKLDEATALVQRVAKTFDGPVTNGLCCMCGEERDHEFHRGDPPECVGGHARIVLAGLTSDGPAAVANQISPGAASGRNGETPARTLTDETGTALGAGSRGPGHDVRVSEEATKTQGDQNAARETAPDEPIHRKGEVSRAGLTSGDGDDRRARDIARPVAEALVAWVDEDSRAGAMEEFVTAIAAVVGPGLTSDGKGAGEAAACHCGHSPSAHGLEGCLALGLYDSGSCPCPWRPAPASPDESATPTCDPRCGTVGRQPLGFWRGKVRLCSRACAQAGRPLNPTREP